jgi:hypothetical protein
LFITGGKSIYAVETNKEGFAVVANVNKTESTDAQQGRFRNSSLTARARQYLAIEKQNGSDVGTPITKYNARAFWAILFKRPSSQFCCSAIRKTRTVT